MSERDFEFWSEQHRRHRGAVMLLGAIRNGSTSWQEAARVAGLSVRELQEVLAAFDPGEGLRGSRLDEIREEACQRTLRKKMEIEQTLGPGGPEREG